MQIIKIIRKIPLIHNELSRARRILVNLLYANVFLKIFLIKIIKRSAKNHYKFLIEFYSRYNHGGALLKGYFAWLIFYALIDPDIRRDRQNVKKFKNLLFKTEAALEWSVGCEDKLEFYLNNGNSSCLTGIIELIKSSGKNDWRLMELGCGSGNCIFILKNHLDKKIGLLDGVDLSPFAISYAKQRFNSSKHNFFTADILEFILTLPKSQEWQYDVIYAHLVFQLFSEKYISDTVRLIGEKKIAKRIFISDSYCDKNTDLAENEKSIYNPDRHGYLRFDHNYYKLLSRNGWSAETLGDYRDSSGFVIVSAELQN